MKRTQCGLLVFFMIVYIFLLCGCNSVSDRMKLSGLIDYIEETSGKSDNVILSAWDYGNDASNPNNLDYVHLYYYGSSELIELDRIRVSINSFLVSNPDSFLNDCAICVFLSYDEYHRDIGMEASFVATTSNTRRLYGTTDVEVTDTDYLQCFAIGSGCQNGDNEIRFSDLSEFEPSIVYLRIDANIEYDDYSFLSSWNELEGVRVNTGNEIQDYATEQRITDMIDLYRE